MIKRILFLFTTVLAFSCSSNDDGGEDGTADSITGTWVATALELGDNPSGNANFMADALDYLTVRDCYVLTYTFTAGGEVHLEESLNYLTINVNPDGTGLDVPCPTESDDHQGSYTYEDGILDLQNASGDDVSIAVDIEGDTLWMDVAQLGIPNFTEGTLVLKKQ